MTDTRVRLLQIEPTTRCNFTCGFCCGRHMPQEDVAFQTFENALRSFPHLEHIELQGEGEPLMHERFFDMIALARERGIKVSFITNGSLLLPAAVEKLLEGGVQKIWVSIESADPKLFREIRGGRLEKVIRNLEHLIGQRRARGLDRPAVGFAITVLNSTREGLHDIFALYHRLGMDGGITLQPLQQLEAYTQHYDASLRGEALAKADADDLFLRFFADPEVREIQNARNPALGFFDELMEGWRPAKRSCPWLDRGVFVNRTGAVSACCMVKDADRFGFGRLGQDDPAAILERRRAMQEQFGRGELPQACEGCELGRFGLMSTGELLRFGAKGVWKRLFGGVATLPPAEDAAAR